MVPPPPLDCTGAQPSPTPRRHPQPQRWSGPRQEEARRERPQDTTELPAACPRTPNGEVAAGPRRRIESADRSDEHAYRDALAYHRGWPRGCRPCWAVVACWRRRPVGVGRRDRADPLGEPQQRVLLGRLHLPAGRVSPDAGDAQQRRVLRRRRERGERAVRPRRHPAPGVHLGQQLVLGGRPGRQAPGLERVAGHPLEVAAQRPGRQQHRLLASQPGRRRPRGLVQPGPPPGPAGGPGPGLQRHPRAARAQPRHRGLREP